MLGSLSSLSKLEVMAFNLNRLKEVAKQPSKKELEEARFREENREWLLQSMQIALKIHHYLRVNGMTQNLFAEKLGISSQMMTKLLSGKERLSSETIKNIEAAIHN